MDNKVKTDSKTCHFCLYIRPNKNNYCIIQSERIKEPKKIIMKTYRVYSTDYFKIDIKRRSGDNWEVNFYGTDQIKYTDKNIQTYNNLKIFMGDSLLKLVDNF